MEPRISIITIVFNCKDYIEETIQSVISQKYINKEYIIIDGASTDGTTEIVYKYEKYIDKIVSEPDKGISDAFNKGIKNATGDLIVFINAGDMILPNALEKVALEYDYNTDIYKGNVIYQDDIKRLRYKCYPNMNFTNPPWSNKVNHQACYVSRKIFDTIGCFNIEYKFYMDIDFFIRVSQKGVRQIHIDEELAVFRVGGISSNNIIKTLPEAYRIVRNNNGGIILAIFYIVYLCVKRVLKIILNTVFPNFIEKKMYKKMMKY